MQKVTAYLAPRRQGKKPTVFATLDDVPTNRRYEIEVTATKVK